MLLESDIRQGFRIYTHDWRSPTVGGNPILTEPARLPITLPSVELDTTEAPHGAGYHFSASLAEAARASGFWPNGRAARCVSVVASADAIERRLEREFPYDKDPIRIRRASALTITAVCAEAEVRAAMLEAVSWAATAVQLVEEQWAWYVALGRPDRREEAVVKGLQVALAHRGLDWTLKRFGTAKDAWAARGPDLDWAPVDDEAAEDAAEQSRYVDHDELYGPSPQNPVLTVGEAIVQWENTVAPWEAQWDRWEPWDVHVANQAMASLADYTAVSEGWLPNRHCAECFTVGIRDAYHHGLAIALPTGPRELGYAMDSP